jgi:hypothetical protein
MMDWVGAGVVGFGTLCGTLNGAAAAIGLICSGRDARAFVSDLLTWYSETELPTNLYAPTGELPQSRADSNLCHISLAHWCRVSGFASGSPERVERCSRLSGDVAAKAVEMLNSSALGLQVPSEKTVCRACHYVGPSYAAGQSTHGEMNCLTCHINLKEKQVVPTGHVQGDDDLAIDTLPNALPVRYAKTAATAKKKPVVSKTKPPMANSIRVMSNTTSPVANTLSWWAIRVDRFQIR